MDIDLTNAHPCPDCRQCLTTEAKCSYCAERETLKQQLAAAVERAERAEAERDKDLAEMRRFQRMVIQLTHRADSAEKTLAGLRAALEQYENTANWGSHYCGPRQAYRFWCGKGTAEEAAKSALAATPAQHAARIRERVLLELAEQCEMVLPGDMPHITKQELLDMADEAAKEAQNG